MKVVAALGGNALLRRGEPLDMPTQRANAHAAARALAELASDHELIVTHGNGPQVGLLALQAAAGGTPTPLDVLGAESDGMIGYVIAQELRNQLPEREVVTVLTQVVVDAADPAFTRPSKPIGPTYPSRTAAEAAAGTAHWSIAPDGSSWRRVVASPQPRAIVELQAIRQLSAAGVIVVCAGGGGVPVRRTAEGLLEGVEAVVDKDLTAALLASDLEADALLLLTDVDAIHLDHGQPTERPVRHASPATLRALDLAAGSMGPKAEAAARFAESGDHRRAAIGRLEDASALLAGETGTTVRLRAPAPTSVVARNAAPGTPAMITPAGGGKLLP